MLGIWKGRPIDADSSHRILSPCPSQQPGAHWTSPRLHLSSDALFTGCGMFYSVYPPWIPSRASLPAHHCKCAGSRDSLQTRDTCFDSDKAEPPPPPTYSSPEGGLNLISRLQIKRWTFLLSVLNVYGGLNVYSMTSRTTELYQLFPGNWTFTGPFTFLSTKLCCQGHLSPSIPSPNYACHQTQVRVPNTQ